MRVPIERLRTWRDGGYCTANRAPPDRHGSEAGGGVALSLAFLLTPAPSLVGCTPLAIPELIDQLQKCNPNSSRGVSISATPRYKMTGGRVIPEHIMSSLRQPRPLSFEGYLELEHRSDTKHEFVAGYIYAMTGAGEAHNRISLNIGFQLRAAARGGPCGVYMADMKMRVEEQDRCYYPDVSVVCDPADDDVQPHQRLPTQRQYGAPPSTLAKHPTSPVSSMAVGFQGLGGVAMIDQ